MRILITGSGGHLGEAIIRTLRDRKIDHTGIDIKNSDYTTHVGSISDKAFIEKSMKRVDAVIHAATLHKPHVATHRQQDFINVNIMGTLNLLEEARRQRVKAFIYTSTTSTFGNTLTPGRDKPAVWVTEETKAIPKNIYGVTKTAAEDICQLFYNDHKLPCLILKTSRFFPEADDNQSIRDLYADENIKANEYLYRRVDVEDVVTAHLLAIEKAPQTGFGKYIISATSPFSKGDLISLRNNAPDVVTKLFPDYEEIYRLRNWRMLPGIDRVYVNEKARTELGWKPKYDFRYVLDCIKKGMDFRSELSKSVGIKGYHSEVFEHGPYPVNG
jgi:nucleoside-diphosphate-sugar epimerase